LFKYKTWVCVIVKRRLILDDSYDVDPLFGREGHRLDGIAGWIGVDEVTAIVVCDPHFERVVTFQTGDVDVLSGGFDTSRALYCSVSS
jgi:hypothetical protein